MWHRHKKTKAGDGYDKSFWLDSRDYNPFDMHPAQPFLDVGKHSVFGKFREATDSACERKDKRQKGGGCQ